MLVQLRIRSVALIDQLDLDFYDGFSVLTGETGAGKSIIIESLNFVLGERASRELITTGAQKCSVEAIFRLGAEEPVRGVLLASDLWEDGTEELSLYRELSQSGRNVCRVNGAPVSGAILKEIGDALVDIHGQHAHQSLLNPRLHIDLLDAFAGEKAASIKIRLLAAHAAYRAAEDKLHASVMNERDRERRCDLLSYQISEIDKAALTDGEEEQLLEQRALLQNAQTIMESLETGGEALNGDEGAMTQLSAALRSLDAIAPYSKEYSEVAERLREAYYTLEDAAMSVRDLRGGFSYDPESLDEIEWRLELISGLKRKYGASIAEILAYRKNIGEEYDVLTATGERKEALEAAYQKAASDYDALAEGLTACRKQAAARLSEKLLPELGDLGMPHAQFEAAFSVPSGDGRTANGADTVEFLLSANQGEPAKPLAKVASGGEISRVMLAFKSVFSETGGIPTMVFDEIDTGISGRIGNAVAEKMAEIAAHHQVLCITHLPQIASYASRQYLVRKEAAGGKTRSTARLLSDDERPAEIARIMGSPSDDPIALSHARKLLGSAQKKS